MTTTVNLQLDTPARGSNVGTWDVPVNGDMTLIDAMLGAGTTSKSLASSPVTLSVSEAQAAILSFSGTLTANVQVTLPAIYKTWTIRNACLGNFVITLTGGSGNVVGLPPGNCQICWDGTNCSFVNFKSLGDWWDTSYAAVPAWVTACTVPPALLPDGSTFNAATYPLLNQHLGGNTLPDARGRGRFSLNGGTSRITTAGSGIDGDTRFSAGGSQNVILDVTMIPAHSHTISISDPGHSHSYTGVTGSGGSGDGGNQRYVAASLATSVAFTGISATASSTGGGAAHNNMPPVYIGGITMIWAV